MNKSKAPAQFNARPTFRTAALLALTLLVTSVGLPAAAVSSEVATEASRVNAEAGSANVPGYPAIRAGQVSDPTGDDATGDDASGDDAVSDTAAGDNTAGENTWTDGADDYDESDGNLGGPDSPVPDGPDDNTVADTGSTDDDDESARDADNGTDDEVPDYAGVGDESTPDEKTNAETDGEAPDLDAGDLNDGADGTAAYSEGYPDVSAYAEAGYAYIDVQVGGVRNPDGTVSLIDGATFQLWTATPSGTGSATAFQPGTALDPAWGWTTATSGEHQAGIARFVVPIQTTVGTGAAEDRVPTASTTNSTTTVAIGPLGAVAGARFFVVQTATPQDYVTHNGTTEARWSPIWNLRTGATNAGASSRQTPYNFLTASVQPNATQTSGSDFMLPSPNGPGGGFNRSDWATPLPTGSWVNDPFNPGQVYGVSAGGTFTAQVPSSQRTDSTGFWANRHANPPLPMQCSATVAIVVDVSSSVTEGGFEENMRQGARDIVNALAGTRSSISTYTFGWNSPAGRAPQVTDGRISVSHAGDANQILEQIDQWQFGATGTTAAAIANAEATNWDDAFRQVAASNQRHTGFEYDVVFFITDGNPTVAGSSVADRIGSGFQNRLSTIEASIFSANTVKSQGSRIVGIGVGDANLLDDESLLNIQAVSGDSVWRFGDAAATLFNADIIRVYDPANLAQIAGQLAFAGCAPALNVNKVVVPYHVTSVEVADVWIPESGWHSLPDHWHLTGGWDITAALAGGSVQLANGADSQTVTTSLTGANIGNAEFLLNSTVADYGTTTVTLNENLVANQPGWTVVNQGEFPAFCTVTTLNAQHRVSTTPVTFIPIAAEPGTGNPRVQFEMAINDSVTCQFINRIGSPLAPQLSDAFEAEYYFDVDWEITKHVLNATGNPVIPGPLTKETVPGEDVPFDFELTVTASPDPSDYLRVSGQFYLANNDSAPMVPGVPAVSVGGFPIPSSDIAFHSDTPIDPGSAVLVTFDSEIPLSYLSPSMQVVANGVSVGEVVPIREYQFDLTATVRDLFPAWDRDGVANQYLPGELVTIPGIVLDSRDGSFHNVPDGIEVTPVFADDGRFTGTWTIRYQVLLGAGVPGMSGEGHFWNVATVTPEDAYDDPHRPGGPDDQTPDDPRLEDEDRVVVITPGGQFLTVFQTIEHVGFAAGVETVGFAESDELAGLAGFSGLAAAQSTTFNNGLGAVIARFISPISGNETPAVAGSETSATDADTDTRLPLHQAGDPTTHEGAIFMSPNDWDGAIIPVVPVDEDSLTLDSEDPVAETDTEFVLHRVPVAADALHVVTATPDLTERMVFGTSVAPGAKYGLFDVRDASEAALLANYWQDFSSMRCFAADWFGNPLAESVDASGNIIYLPEPEIVGTVEVPEGGHVVCELIAQTSLLSVRNVVQDVLGEMLDASDASGLAGWSILVTPFDDNGLVDPNLLGNPFVIDGINWEYLNRATEYIKLRPGVSYRVELLAPQTGEFADFGLIGQAMHAPYLPGRQLGVVRDSADWTGWLGADDIALAPASDVVFNAPDVNNNGIRLDQWVVAQSLVGVFGRSVPLSAQLSGYVVVNLQPNEVREVTFVSAPLVPAQPVPPPGQPGTPPSLPGTPPSLPGMPPSLPGAPGAPSRPAQPAAVGTLTRTGADLIPLIAALVLVAGGISAVVSKKRRTNKVGS